MILIDIKKEILNSDFDFNQLNLIDSSLFSDIYKRYNFSIFRIQYSKINVPILWINKEKIVQVIKFLKDCSSSYNMLYDQFGIDETERIHKEGFPKVDFSIVYYLFSIEFNKDFIIKVPLLKEDLNISSIVSVFPNANWYEREIWDMFGINFYGHPNLIRLLMPIGWVGHPLCKNYSARATEFDESFLREEKIDLEMKNLVSISKKNGFKSTKNNNDDYYHTIFLNFGPNHPSAHGIFRIILKLDGEEIIDCIPDIGYHHRGAEKMAERQTWHTYIPYTDRIEYLGGCMNEMPYILAIEKFFDIKVSCRIQTIRVMLSELFRINSHLLCISTFIQDIGLITPVFLAFVDRQKVYDVIEFITGSRMHPAWFRIGGLSKDLPKGWEKKLKDLIDWLPRRINTYINLAMKNSILKSRSVGVASYTKKEALEWGVTGVGLRATGVAFDIRKYRPYSGYDYFDFDIPISVNGDCYDRIMLKIEELWQSLKILRQCLDNMPEGNIHSEHFITTPFSKESFLNDIESLINHFLKVSIGPIVPFNESFQMIEATKGINSYYLISDGGSSSYRTRIRTPSFAHLQQIPSVIRGSLISDLVAYLGSIDFVMSDVDR